MKKILAISLGGTLFMSSRNGKKTATVLGEDYDVFYDFPEPVFAQSPEPQNVRQAINHSLKKLMTKYEELVIIGEDISDDQFDSGAQYGGAFKVTTGPLLIFLIFPSTQLFHRQVYFVGVLCCLRPIHKLLAYRACCHLVWCKECVNRHVHQSK